MTSAAKKTPPGNSGESPGSPGGSKAQLRPQPHGGWLKSGETTDGWPRFDSMDQCSARTGIPKDRLREWKSAGAPGFHGSRVHIGELLPWMCAKIFAPVEISESGEIFPAVITWQDVKDRQQFQERAKILIEAAVALGIIRDALLPLRQFLLSMAVQLCSLCNPTDPVLAQTVIEKHVKQGMRIIADAERAKIK